MTHNWKIKKQNFFCFQSKNFPPDKRQPGQRSRYGKYGPRSGYGFLRTACQPIRIENFEKPYNKMIYYISRTDQILYQTIMLIFATQAGFTKRMQHQTNNY